MSADRDIDRLLDAWFADGPMQVADHVFDEAVGRVHRQRQRPAWRLLWKEPTMSPLKAVLGAAAVILVIVAGFAWIGRSGDQIGGVAGPTPSPSPTPSPIPLSGPTTSLAPGTYAVRVNAGRLAFTVPDGWAAPQVAPQVGPSLIDFPLHRIGDPADDVVDVFFDIRRAAKDAPCTGGPEPGVGATAQALAADFQSDPNLQVTPPTPIQVGALQGLVVDMTLATNATRTCPFSSGAPTDPLVAGAVAGTPPYWGIGPGEKMRLVILDAPGVNNIVVLVDSAAGGSFDALVNAAMPVIQTLVYSPT